jgi:FixJ family two-component response regulator
MELWQDGTQLLAYFLRQPADGERLLMFVDLVMKPRDGLEWLNILKAYPLAQRSVTVMLSGLNDVRNMRKAYEAGAITFLLKPITVQDIDNLLNGFHQYFTVEQNALGRTIEWT